MRHNTHLLSGVADLAAAPDDRRRLAASLQTLNFMAGNTTLRGIATQLDK